MPEFKQTEKKGNSHTHIVYLNTDAGMTSKSKDHSHTVRYYELPKDQPYTPDMPVGWKVDPAPDGHTHELTDYRIKEKDKTHDEKEALDDNIRLYKEAKEIEKGSRKKAKESERFVCGEQWSKTGKQEMESKSRAALTLNEIEGKMDLLSGYQRRNRTDMKFLPVEEGDVKVAEILNVVVKNIFDQCNFESEDSDVFNEMGITGRGNFNVYVDYSDNVRGDIKIECFHWEDVLYGPHVKKDASDCEFIVKQKWVSKAKLKQLFPDKADEVQKELDIYLNNESPYKENRTGYIQDPDLAVELPTPDPDLIDIQRKEYKLLEIWRKEYHRAHVLVNQEDDFYFNAEGWPIADINAVKSIPGFSVISKEKVKMRVVTTASKTLCSDEYPELVWDDYYMIPVYAKKLGNSWWGKIESAKDAQMEINKRHSQVIDIANKMTAYGWFIDAETFVKDSEKVKFQNNSSSPGFVSEVSNLSKIPVKVEGSKFPTELVNIMALDSQKIKEIMNVNLEMQGMGKASQSGVAIAQQKQQGLLGNEFLFDNHNLSKRKLGKLILRLIKKCYNPERIYRVLQNQNFKQKVQIQGQDVEKYPKETIIAMLNDADLEKYDVVVSESPWSPSNRLANFIMLKELATQGVPIPPQLLIEYSDIPDKEKAMQMIAAAQEQQASAERQKAEMEIGKTKIAAQSKLQAEAMKAEHSAHAA